MTFDVFGIALCVFGWVIIGSNVPGLLGSVLGAGWAVGIRVLYERRTGMSMFGGRPRAPIVHMVDVAGFLLFCACGSPPFAAVVVFTVVWSLMVDLPWSQRFPW